MAKTNAARRRAFEKRQALLHDRLDPKKRGELSELAFLYKAASMGFAVAKPYGDSDRFDFIVHSRGRFWRVQVRSSSSLQYGAYQVSAHTKSNGHAIPYTADEIDFLVVHIVPEDVWYVIPVRAFTPHKTLQLFPQRSNRAGRYEKYREAWCLLE
jgi:hypothetical protein